MPTSSFFRLIECPTYINRKNLRPHGPGRHSSLAIAGGLHCLNGLPTVDSGQ